MANSLDLKKLADFPEFRDRVKYNLVYITSQIICEPIATPNYTERHLYGVAIVRNPDVFINNFCASLVVNPNIAQNIKINIENPENNFLSYTGNKTPTTEFDEIDIEIQNVLSEIYNNLAGVKSS